MNSNHLSVGILYIKHERNTKITETENSLDYTFLSRLSTLNRMCINFQVVGNVPQVVYEAGKGNIEKAKDFSYKIALLIGGWFLVLFTVELSIRIILAILVALFGKQTKLVRRVVKKKAAATEGDEGGEGAGEVDGEEEEEEDADAAAAREGGTTSSSSAVKSGGKRLPAPTSPGS